MFTLDVNTTCNTFCLVATKIPRMHEQMKRLYTAAKELRGIETQAELARALNQSSQTVKNWEARGISKNGMLEAQRSLGCSATWLETGLGDMALVIPSGPVFPGALPVVGTDGSDEPLPTRVRIPKVMGIRLSAGLSRVSVDYDRRDDGVWDVPRRWLEKGRYVRECLYAIEVHGESMEPNYYDGDVVVIDTADRVLVSGHVYAVNCEGESVIKRLVKEGALWYLYSDNPLPRYHKVLVTEGRVEIIGKIVLRQTYHVT